MTGASDADKQGETLATSPLSHAVPAHSPDPRPARRKTGPLPVTTLALLQVAIIWRGQIIGYRLLRKRQRITVGPSKRATFVTPALE